MAKPKIREWVKRVAGTDFDSAEEFFEEYGAELTDEELNYYAQEDPWGIMCAFPGDAFQLHRRLTRETIDVFIREAPEDVLEKFNIDLLTPEQFKRCIEREPSLAVENHPEKVPPEIIDKAAEKNPEKALESFPLLLTPERFKFCIKKEPRVAIKYCASLLTPKQIESLIAPALAKGDSYWDHDVFLEVASVTSSELLEKYAMKYPSIFLQYKELSSRISKETLIKIAKKSPSSALRRPEIRKKLPQEVIDYCVKKSPATALEVIPTKLTEKQLMESAIKTTATTLKTQRSLLTLPLKVLDACARKSPKIATSIINGYYVKDKKARARLLKSLTPKTVVQIGKIAADDSNARAAVHDLKYEFQLIALKEMAKLMGTVPVSGNVLLKLLAAK